MCVMIRISNKLCHYYVPSLPSIFTLPPCTVPHSDFPGSVRSLLTSVSDFAGESWLGFSFWSLASFDLHSKRLFVRSQQQMYMSLRIYLYIILDEQMFSNPGSNTRGWFWAGGVCVYLANYNHGINRKMALLWLDEICCFTFYFKFTLLQQIVCSSVVYIVSFVVSNRRHLK